MAQEKLLTIREVSGALGITEKEVIELAESGQIPAYKVGGVYLRFKRDQIESYLKRSGKVRRRKDPSESPGLGDTISDFFYFYDFYIFAALIILLMLAFILKSYQ